jgi:lipid-binding SYLF domain-containing protein
MFKNAFSSIVSVVVPVLLSVFTSSTLTFGLHHSQTSPKPAEKFRHAVNRSEDAGRILSTLAQLPDSGMPKEVIDRAEAIAIFPKVVKHTDIITQVSKGYGVISARQGKGWTMPAFYRFRGEGFGGPFEDPDAQCVILLFMNKDALSWFEKGGVPLKNEKRAVDGPVGTISTEQRKKLENVPILAYSYFNGRLNGTSFGKSFWKAFNLNPDNNINNPVYGLKGREVLAGKQIDPAVVIPGISSYRDALIKYYAGS